LLTWECLGDRRGPAVLALSSTVLAWLSFQWLPGHVSADAQATFFLIWSIPLAVVLGLWLYAPQLGSKFSRSEPNRAVSPVGGQLRIS
jgi:hypothetical protein